jgi:hypothetical protein
LAEHLFAGNDAVLELDVCGGKRAGKGRHAAHVSDAVTRRIVIAQSLYAFGALLCLVNPYWSIGFIVLVQLNYVIAPRFGRRARE